MMYMQLFLSVDRMTFGNIAVCGIGRVFVGDGLSVYLHGL
jgi:hypothetical protein